MPLIDVTDAFDGWEESIQLTRKASGTRDANGEWVNGATTVTNPLAVVQSLNADERLVLPEAVRTKETIKIHSRTPFQTANEDSQIIADEVLYQGVTYIIIQVFNRLNVGGYYKAIGAKK